MKTVITSMPHFLAVHRDMFLSLGLAQIFFQPLKQHYSTVLSRRRFKLHPPGTLGDRSDFSPNRASPYYYNGKQKREPTLYCGGKKNGRKIEALEENREAVEKFLKHRINEMTAERYGGPAFLGPERRRTTVAQLLDALESDCKLRGVQSSQWASHIKQVRRYFGDCRAVDLTTEHVDSYIQQRLEDVARPATVNRNTQLLAQAYKLAIERKQLTAAPLIRHLSESGNARQGFFSETEFRTVASNLPPDLADFALFGYLPGWRKGEIRSLRWADVDGDTVRLLAENSKNGESRIITLDGQLAELIERRKKARP
jgi:hypothetical protein